MNGSAASEPMSAVRIREISPRLGLQAHNVDTEIKIELVERLIAAGMKAIEVSSFVNPKLVPGLGDAETVFARVPRVPGVSLECCVGNVTRNPAYRSTCTAASIVPG